MFIKMNPDQFRQVFEESYKLSAAVQIRKLFLGTVKERIDFNYSAIEKAACVILRDREEDNSINKNLLGTFIYGCEILRDRAKDNSIDKNLLRSFLDKNGIVAVIKMLLAIKYIDDPSWPDRFTIEDLCFYVCLLKALLEVEDDGTSKVNYDQAQIWSAWLFVMDEYKVMEKIEDEYDGSWAKAIVSVNDMKNIENEPKRCIIL